MWPCSSSFFGCMEFIISYASYKRNHPKFQHSIPWDICFWLDKLRSMRTTTTTIRSKFYSNKWMSSISVCLIFPQKASRRKEKIHFHSCNVYRPNSNAKVLFHFHFFASSSVIMCLLFVRFHSIVCMCVCARMCALLCELNVYKSFLSSTTYWIIHFVLALSIDGKWCELCS